MHQSIPAAPNPPPPPLGYCVAFSQGWGICKFCIAQGPGICQLRPHSRAFDTHTVESNFCWYYLKNILSYLFDCAINEISCSVNWRRAGHLPSFFRPHPGGFDSSRVPTPGNLPSKGKKMLMPRGYRVTFKILTYSLKIEVWNAARWTYPANNPAWSMFLWIEELNMAKS